MIVKYLNSFHVSVVLRLHLLKKNRLIVRLEFHEHFLMSICLQFVTKNHSTEHTHSYTVALVKYTSVFNVKEHVKRFHNPKMIDAYI